jgi:enoyl-[acyl-carrier protein] reductase II
MLKMDICNLFGVEYPIIQGGMAHLATAELASAVSNAGGLGLIAAANYESNWLRNQINLARSLTIRPFGVNLYTPSQFINDQINIILKEKIPIVVFGGGNPEKFISILKESGIIVVPVVSNSIMGYNMASIGVDALIAEGMEAGGHIGKDSLFSLIPSLVDTVHIPVIAAGGIVDGRGLVAALSLGAQGIQMGTRFIYSNESGAHPSLKQIVLNSSVKTTVIIGSSIGRPIRCLYNRFTANYIELEKNGASREELNIFIKGRLHLGIIEGDLDEGLIMIGQSIGLIKEIKPAKDIITEIMTQYYNILTKFKN